VNPVLSWDRFGGFPANPAAIEMMKQYCAAHIGVENGDIIASSKGLLHIHDYVLEIAEAIRAVPCVNSGRCHSLVPLFFSGH